MSAALVLVPITAAAPLYQIEEHLAALVDTAELVPADQEQAFIAELREALQTVVEKRDRVGQFMAHCEAQMGFAAAEIKRLQERKAMYQRALDSIEGYVVRVIEELGKDAKGKHRKLEGKTLTFSIRACPASVEVTDEASVPAEYKRLTVTLPAPTWEALLDNLDIEGRNQVIAHVTKSSCDVLKTPIKDAITAGIEIPGARLITGKHSLRRD